MKSLDRAYRRNALEALSTVADGVERMPREMLFVFAQDCVPVGVDDLPETSAQTAFLYRSGLERVVVEQEAVWGAEHQVGNEIRRISDRGEPVVPFRHLRVERVRAFFGVVVLDLSLGYTNQPVDLIAYLVTSEPGQQSLEVVVVPT